MDITGNALKLQMDEGADRDLLRQDLYGTVIQGMISYRKVVADLTSLALDLDNEWRDRQATLGEIVVECAR